MDPKDGRTLVQPALLARFDELQARYWPGIRSFIMRAAQRCSPPSSPLLEMLEFQLSTGGKRLRALLPLLVAELLGESADRMVPFGAACEILHNAALVHDDLQDGDEYRRGQPAVWHKYGKARAINLGDAMILYATQCIQSLPVSHEQKNELLQHLVTHTIAVIDGQEREFALKREDPSLERYFEAVEGKTSALFVLPIAYAAELCGAPEALVSALEHATREMGVLFQIQDDVLDLYGEKGRNLRGSDLYEGKRSLLVVHAYEKSGPQAGEEILTLLDTPRDQTSAQQVTAMLAIFERHDSLAFALDEIRRRRDAALHTPGLEDSPALQALITGICHLFLRPIESLLREHEAAPAS